MTYAEKLRDPRWQKKRLQIFNRDKFTCKLCKDTKTTLQVHHLSYSGNPWESLNKDLITLCEHCHEEVENLKKNDAKFCFKNLSINKIRYKSGSRIIFMIHNSELITRVYNSDGKVHLFTIGDKYDSDVIELKKLLKKL